MKFFFLFLRARSISKYYTRILNSYRQKVIVLWRSPEISTVNIVCLYNHLKRSWNSSFKMVKEEFQNPRLFFLPPRQLGSDWSPVPHQPPHASRVRITWGRWYSASAPSRLPGGIVSKFYLFWYKNPYGKKPHRTWYNHCRNLDLSRRKRKGRNTSGKDSQDG